MKSVDRPLRVFLCHSSADKPAVRELYQKLRAESWIDPWLDEKKLLPGQDWDLVIEKAVEDSHAVIACLSSTSVTKEGYIQKELRFVLDIALTKPEEEIFVIPLRLDDCQPPRRLRAFHYVDYFPGSQKDNAYQFVLQSLKRRAENLGIEVVDVVALARQQAEEQARKELEERLQREAREKVQQELEEHLRIETEERVRKEIQKQTKSNQKNAGKELRLRREGQDESVADVKNKLIAKTPKSAVVKKLMPSESKKTNKSFALRASKNITLSNGMEFFRVPAGEFLMGSTKTHVLAYDDEKPQHVVTIPYTFWCAHYLITNEQYNGYVKSKRIKHPVMDWEEKKDHPVTRVSYNHAKAFCQWLNESLRTTLPSGLILGLPTEAEWEKAARGKDGREYPWGSAFEKERCNSRESGINETTPVGLYSPRGDSPYGCADVSGNVWEWTRSLFMPYPYIVDSVREDEESSIDRVLRGGSFNNDYNSTRSAYRYVSKFIGHFGIRLVLSPKLHAIVKYNPIIGAKKKPTGHHDWIKCSNCGYIQHRNNGKCFRCESVFENK